jgi:hypothetical protein
MSAIFGELLTFFQDKGPDVSLRVYGDEFYARYETVDGYSVIYDLSLGRFVYAQLRDGHFIPSGLDLSMDPPPGVPPHLEEADEVRNAKADNRFSRRWPSK